MRVRLRPERLILHHVLSGEEGISKAKALVPDLNLILLDVSMPGRNGLETTRLLKQKFPQTKILIITQT